MAALLRTAYDAAEFMVPEGAASTYWESNTRKVYRFLKYRDIKSSLRNSEVYILWPADGVWYKAEVDQVPQPLSLSVKSLHRHLCCPAASDCCTCCGM